MQKLYTYIIILCCLCCGSVVAQNSTSSPFSRYGYGDLNDNTPNTYRAMGGVGIGMRSNRVISPSQPASYTACDTMCFMFDLGAGVSWTNLTDAGGVKNSANGNLEYLSLQFPIYKKWLAFSAGILPYSSVGYNMSIADSVGSSYHYVSTYTGAGGISEVYAGLSFNLFNYFALGANIYYMFGDVTNTRSLVFAESGLNATNLTENLRVSNMRIRYGAQLFHTWGDHTFVLGGVFENQHRMANDSTAYTAIESNTADTVMGYQMGAFTSPMYYGGGLSYTWADRLTIGFDYARSCMASALFNGQPMSTSYRDVNRYAFGVEYRNNPLGRRYVDRVMWRCGVSVYDEYLHAIAGKSIRACIGVGLPLRNTATVFNATLEYTHRGSKDWVEENTLKLTLNAAIAETWFFKRKL